MFTGQQYLFINRAEAEACLTEDKKLGVFTLANG